MKEWKNRSIKLFNSEWNIVFEDKIFLLDENDSNSLVFGATEEESHLIRVALHNSKGTRFSDTHIEKTLLHELIHAILDEGCFNETQNESLVQHIAIGLEDLIKQKVLGGYEAT